MTSQSVFLAAFLGSTIGWLTLQIIRHTIIQPLLTRAQRWLRSHMKANALSVTELQANGANVAECACCKCGDKHAAFTDRHGTILGPE